MPEPAVPGPAVPEPAMPAPAVPAVTVPGVPLPVIPRYMGMKMENRIRKPLTKMVSRYEDRALKAIHPNLPFMVLIRWI